MKKIWISQLLASLAIVSGLALTAPASAFELHNYSTDYCLAVNRASQASGATLIAYHCDGTPSQQWGYNDFGVALPDPPSNGSFLGYYLVSSVAANRYLTATPNTSTLSNYGALINGDVPNVSVYTGINFQQWEMQMQGRDFRSHPCYTIGNRASTYTQTGIGAPMVLGVQGGSKAEGARVMIWSQFFTKDGHADFIGHPDQYWCVYQ
jgi:hypothetical protein